jgi:hypothetical protein
MQTGTYSTTCTKDKELESYSIKLNLCYLHKNKKKEGSIPLAVPFTFTVLITPCQTNLNPLAPVQPGIFLLDFSTSYLCQ